MKKTRRPLLIILALALVFSLAACGEKAPEVSTDPSTPPPEETPAAGADLVLKNGHIQTLVSEDDVAQAIAITGNTIVYVGDDAGVEEFVGADTQVIDLEGQFVAPGFMDGHLHGPQPYYEQMFQITLPEHGGASNELYLKLIKEFVDANPDMDIYYGGAFMQNVYMLEDGSNPGPQKEDLDAICSDKPIMIRDVSHHAMWANSKALEIAGITKDTPDPEGGVIARNADGEPSGLLTDTAKNMLTAVIDVGYEVDKMKIAYEAFQEYCHSVGITGLTNINLSGEEFVHLDAMKEMEEEGNLFLRQEFLVWGNASSEYDVLVKRLEEVKAYESDMISTGTVKIVVDGVTEGATAVMLEPYLEAAGRGEGWIPASNWEKDALLERVRDLDAAGYQVHIHAIGDGGVRLALDAYEYALEENGDKDLRHTIVHVSAIDPADITRMADMGIVANLQFLWMYNDFLCKLEAAFVGEERAMAFYPTKDMLEAGCIISGGSDGAVTSYHPLEQIETGITRNSPYPEEEDTDMYRWPEQGLTAYQLLEIYTKNVAYENHIDDKIGTIEVGKLADLVVLGDNILTIDPKLISDTPIVYTISNGVIVYKG